MAMTLRLPADLQAEAAELAGYMGCSVNALVIQALRGFVQYHNGRRGVELRNGGASVSSGHVVATTGVARVGANQPCPCGSGQKYKRCHGKA